MLTRKVVFFSLISISCLCVNLRLSSYYLVLLITCGYDPLSGNHGLGSLAILNFWLFSYAIMFFVLMCASGNGVSPLLGSYRV